MKIEIRKATTKDFKVIQELNHELFLHEYDRFDKTLDCEWPFKDVGIKYFKERMSKTKGCLLLAFVDGKVVGCLIGSVIKTVSYRNVRSMAELESIYILEDYQKLGIGTRFVSEFISWCRKRRVERITVRSSAKNEQALAFYRKNGFKDHDAILEFLV
jgi:ribosomal protein S18 acetylase RimI-like enzyme